MYLYTLASSIQELKNLAIFKTDYDGVSVAS